MISIKYTMKLKQIQENRWVGWGWVGICLVDGLLSEICKNLSRCTHFLKYMKTIEE